MFLKLKCTENLLWRTLINGKGRHVTEEVLTAVDAEIYEIVRLGTGSTQTTALQTEMHRSEDIYDTA